MGTEPVDSLDQYCRDVETYLCRKNDGHLIRIVGPTFELVCGWARRGVPLTLAFRGIDRYFERHQRGERRRPVRIDFCDADVLDLFDEWRRAVGVGIAGSAPGDDGQADRGADERRKGSIRAHVDRVVLKISSLKATQLPRGLEEYVDRALETLDVLRGSAKVFRGETRVRATAELSRLDADMLAAARSSCPDDLLAKLAVSAGLEIEPFRVRMPETEYEQVLRASLDRQLREHFDLPTISYS